MAEEDLLAEARARQKGEPNLALVLAKKKKRREIRGIEERKRWNGWAEFGS